MTRLMLYFSFFLFGAFFQDAQAQIHIDVMVRDKSGAALSGVTVLEKGAKNGTISDPDGNFNFTLSNVNSVLNFSTVGYILQEVIVGIYIVNNHTHAAEMKDLDEVVVVEYGT